MGKGSNSTQTTQSGSSSVSPDSNAYQAYLALLNRASGVASTPYQGFQGEETAPINAQQTAGIGDINQAQGNIAGMGPISSADIQKYQDPYTNDVIHATQADFDVQNQRANSTVTGNAAAQGALGGDRVGVAQALTAEGQARVQAPVIAGLRSSGYQQAVNTAENQQKFGLTAQQAALQGAGQEVGAGTLQQTTQQNQDTQARQDYYQQQGYPFQVAQWLASIDTGVGGSMGSSSTSTGNASTQGPTPNPWTQLAGLGLSAAAMFPKKDGGRINGRRAGFAPYAEGGGVNDDYNSQLSPTDELAFQAWKSQNAPNDSGADYDLRGAYLANMQRSPDNGHMGDRFKKPNHPTFSDQSQYAVGDQRDRAGFWVGPDGPDQTFVPPVATKFRGGRMMRAGFAAGGMPWAGSDTWVPTASIHASAPTAHASMPSAPQAPKQAGLSADQSKGFGVLAQKGAGLFDSDSYGGGNFLTDAYGGSASSPLPGLTAADYGSWRGGRIKRATGGFADGGMPDFSDRFDASYPNMAAGVGASKPAYEPAAPTYDDGGGPFRLSAPEDLDEWRGRVDRDNGKKITAAASDAGLPPPQLAAAPDDTSLPPEVTAGVSSKARMTASAAPPEGAEDDTEALGYAGSPRMKPGVGAPQNLTATEQEKPGGILNSLGIKMTPELRQGLLQAGLSMMATTRGGPGSFLGSVGEAGMAGVGGYEKSQQAALKQAQTEREQAIENEKLRMTGETHQQQMAAAPILADGRVNPAWINMKKQEAEISQKDNWSLIPGDGMTTPDRLFNKATGEFKDTAPGKGEAALNAVQNGQYNYATSGPHLEKGEAIPEPVPVAGRSVDTLKSDAATYASTGVLPKSPVSPKTPAGIQAQLYQNAVKNYAVTQGLSKGLTPEAMSDLRRFGVGAAKFPLSRQGDQTVAIGTAIRHIGALEEYAKAWDASKGNVNAPILRQAASKFAKFIGKEEPTNLEQAARIAGPEIIKAIGVAGAGTGGERYAQEEGFQPGASTQQILGAANVARTFLAGQLPAKEAQARNVGFPHERFMDMVGPQEYDYLSAINHGKPAEDHGATVKPTLADFLAKAKSANPNSTEKDLTDYYNKKYGG